ncbi:MAG: shikimate dehydrogenase [Solirubrobacterales bacterium]
MSEGGLRRLAVLGHPVAHSRSPAMQNAALAALGLGEGWRYEAVDVEPGRFEALVRGMEAMGFVGANVTVPHKEAALALADEHSEAAGEIGAANTLGFGGGRIRADNTDAEGFLAALPEPPGGVAALVLGAGGAARAVVWALHREGAEVEVWNRTPERAVRLCAEIGGRAVERPEPSRYGLIVNCSAAGLGGGDPFASLPLGPADLRPEMIVSDLVYGEGPGPLLEAASAAGARTVDGIEVLVRQGAASLRIWTGLVPPLEVMREAARSG